MERTMSIIDVQESSFEKDVLQESHEQPVVVDFWAAWCGPCRTLGPILERLASEPNSEFLLAKVDVDSNPGLSMRYGVQGIPAVKAFKDGKVIDEFVGAQPEPMVRQFLERIAPSEASNSLSAAELLLAERRWGEAKFYLSELEQIVDIMTRAERLNPLAEYMCSFAEQDQTNAELTVVESKYRQGAILLGQGMATQAMDSLLDVLRYNKDYRNGQAKEVMLGMFEMLGDEDPLTRMYRSKTASILF